MCHWIELNIINIYNHVQHTVYQRFKWHVTSTHDHILPSSIIFKASLLFCFFSQLVHMHCSVLLFFLYTVIIVRLGLYFSESNAQCEEFVLLNGTYAVAMLRWWGIMYVIMQMCYLLNLICTILIKWGLWTKISWTCFCLHDNILLWQDRNSLYLILYVLLRSCFHQNKWSVVNCMLHVTSLDWNMRHSREIRSADVSRDPSTIV